MNIIVFLYSFFCKKATLTGVVSDSDGQPLAGVTVTASSRSTRSKNNGSYKISRLPIGQYPVMFKKEGYEIVIK